MRTRLYSVSAAAALFVLCFAQTASAQRYGGGYGGGGGYRRPGVANTIYGPYLEGGLDLATGIGGDLGPFTGPGIGLEGTLGIRFNPAFALEATLRDSIHIAQDENGGAILVDLFLLDGAAKLYLQSPGRTDVFLRLGVGVYGVANNDANQVLAGLGGSLGLGYDMRVSNNAYVGLEARVHAAQLTDGGGFQTLAIGEIIPRIGVNF
jgi:hypothetical protein